MHTKHTWSDAAKAELEKHFQNIREGLVRSGADVSEVEDDIRRHVDHELTLKGLQIVTREDVQGILSRLGPTVDTFPTTEPLPRKTSKTTTALVLGFVSKFSLTVFGILLPLGALITELVTGIWSSSVFDPIPTLWHALLIALVPLSAGLSWRYAKTSSNIVLKRVARLNAIALAVALYYTLVFLPFTPFAALGILYVGLGFLPLSPLLSLLVLLRLRRGLRLAAEAHQQALPPFWKAFTAGFLVLVLLEAPTVLTSIGLNMASETSTHEVRSTGIRMLRCCGSKDLMLRSCYPGQTEFGGASVRSMLFGFFLHPVPQDSAQKTYFRVTGSPFNSVPPPDLRGLRGARLSNRDDFQWDGAHGGENVSARIKGLNLNESRLDSIVDPASGTVYTEWIMIFRNDSRVQREARAQITLPPDGVVSRVTLWVDGEEREAAYSGRQHVKEAYKMIAVQQRRDPVLVTTSGRDQVLMQCFPVPPNGGTMKIKIGVTCPIDLEKRLSGLAKLPYMRERNFGLPDDFRHSLWFESPDPISLIAPATGELGSEPAGRNGTSIRGRVKDELLCGDLAFRCERSSTNETIWATAKDGNSPAVIAQHVITATAEVPDHVVIVIDGSTWMKDHSWDLANILENLPARLPVTLITAGDEPIIEASSIELSKGKASLRKLIEDYDFVGGQDNLTALTLAWNEAGKTPRGAILWLHATQPVMLSGIEELTHSWERRPGHPLLYEYQFGNGPDRISEQLASINAYQPIPNYGNPKTDLQRLLAQWSGTNPVYRFERTRQEGVERLDGVDEGSSHIARLWAHDEVLRLASSIRSDDIHHAVDIAVAHRLVTPVSGAVVLETAAQYQQTGLTPIDPADAPRVTPEPSTIVMLLIGGGMFAIAIWRKRHSRLATAA